MDYTWNINKLIKHRKILYLLLNETNKNSQEFYVIKKEIDSINYMINIVNNKEEYTLKKVFGKTKLLLKENYDNYYKIPSYLRKIISKAFNTLNDYYDSYEGISLPKMNLSNQELVDYCHNIYENLPTSNRKYVNLFERMTNPKNNLLYFEYGKYNNFYGYNIPVYYPKYIPYFHIYRDNTFLDVLTLNHEISHGIFFKPNKGEKVKHTCYFLQELEGYFFEYLTFKVSTQKINSNIFKDWEESMFSNFYDNLISLYIHKLAINELEKTGDITLLGTCKKMLEDGIDIKMDECLLKEYLRENPLDNSKYILSYLAFLDIERIYDNDPEKVFNSFVDIRESNDVFIFDVLNNNNVTFINDGFDSLKDEKRKIMKINS